MMGSSPMVSVILPTYNRADLLPGTINSVLDQKFSNLELLVVDDGSTDHTEKIINDIRKSDPRIQYLKLSINRGVGFARDYGLRRARGRYIGWADSDDLWMPNKLDVQVDILDRYPEIDLLFGDFINTDHINGVKWHLFAQNYLAMKNLQTCQIDTDVFLIKSGLEKALLQAVFVSLPTMLFRANIIDKIGSFDIALGGAEDFEFFYRAALFELCFAYIDCPLMNRNKFESGLTANKTVSWQEKIEALRRCRWWCKKSKRPDLLSHILVAENRAWRNLISAYGHNRKRNKAFRAYRNSLIRGFSFRNLLFAIAAIFGPNMLLCFKRFLLFLKRRIYQK